MWRPGSASDRTTVIEEIEFDDGSSRGVVDVRPRRRAGIY